MRRRPVDWLAPTCVLGARASGRSSAGLWAGAHVTGAVARSCARALVHHVSRRHSPRQSGGCMSCHVRAMRARAWSCAVAWLAVTVADVRGVGAHMAPRACELSRPARARDPVKHSCAARGRREGEAGSILAASVVHASFVSDTACLVNRDRACLA